MRILIKNISKNLILLPYSLQIRKLAERRLLLEAKKIKELTQCEMELHGLDVTEQKLRVAIAKEQLNQEKLRTKLMSMSMEMEEKGK